MSFSRFHRLLAGAVLFALGSSWLAVATAAADSQTATGNFTGDYQGTFVSTLTSTTTGSTLQVTYTRHGDRATRTDQATISALDGQGGYTLDESRVDFGATAADTAHIVFTRVSAGRQTGTGTFTTAGGDTGTLRAVLSSTAGGISRSELHASATTGNTLLLRVERTGDGSVGVKVLAFNPDGSLTASSLVRYAGSPASTPTPAPTPIPTPTPTPTPAG